MVAIGGVVNGVDCVFGAVSPPPKAGLALPPNVDVPPPIGGELLIPVPPNMFTGCYPELPRRPLLSSAGGFGPPVGRLLVGLAAPELAELAPNMGRFEEVCYGAFVNGLLDLAAPGGCAPNRPPALG